MAKKNVHESEELNALLGKRVKIVLFNNTIHTGILGKSEYSDRYKLDRTEMSIDRGDLCFYKTHVKKAEATSRLRGWGYINSLMYECPECGQKPFLGNTCFTNQWQLACMNVCCHNMNVVVHGNPFMAIIEWNKLYGRKPRTPKERGGEK